MAKRETTIAPDLLDRLPPQSLDAERNVLGSILLDPRILDEVAPLLKADDFYADAHRRLYVHLSAMHAAGKPLDVALLMERMRQAGEFEAVGGPAYLAEVVHAVPVAAHAVYYAQIVREKARLRRLIGWATDVLGAAYSPQAQAGDVAELAEAGLVKALDTGGDNGPRTWEDLLLAVCHRADEALKRQDGGGVMTGIEELDRAAGGLWQGELVILAARTSIGKTALAVQIAERVSRRPGCVVYIASLEMSAADITMRLVCGQAGVNTARIRTGTLSAEEVSRLGDATNHLAGRGLVLHDCPGMGLPQIRSQARRLLGKGLRLVVVDYLQLIAPSTPSAPRVQQVSEISAGLKELARELNVPVLALSQLNRQVTAGNKSEPPALWHLRDSGSIEQDADMVLLLHRHPSERPARDGLETWDSELELAKNRNGPLVRIRLNWDGDKLRFVPPGSVF